MKNITLAVLAAFYPVIFLYSHNNKIIQYNSLVFPLLLVLLLAVIVYGLFYAFQRKAVSASLSTVGFMVLFYGYSPLYQLLLKRDWLQVEHYTLIPLVLVAAGYLGYLIARIPPKTAAGARNILLLVVSVLVVFNIASAVPGELQKAQAKRTTPNPIQVASTSPTAQKRPDIYFIIFDEYAGFDAIREYWHDDYVNDFEAFLKQKNFFVTDKSRSKTTITIVEVASRLNLKRYVNTNWTIPGLFDAIANNKMMQIMKSYGYTTVAFNDLKSVYPTFPKIQADYLYDHDSSIDQTADPFIDDFGKMVLDQTMFSSLSNSYKTNDPEIAKSRSVMLYSLYKTANLKDVPSPKFVYTHLMLPHVPFSVNENGGPIDLKDRFNWNYYLKIHKFATQQAEKMVTQILANADPNNPPIIVLQSDHGARNHQGPPPDAVLLQNYPDRYQTMILNALYLPGFDYSQLPPDMDPTETFAIILNHYFNAGVTIDDATQGK